MLKSILIALTIAISLGAKAQANDSTEIIKIVNLYLRVTDYKDSAAIGTAFHNAAKLMSVSKNAELNEMTQAEWWSRVSKIPNASVRESKTTILAISGIAATVRVDFLKSTDLISLLKFGNDWKIVNKTLSVVL